MERNYTTQMDAARRGIITTELETVARKEQMRVEELLPLVACGKDATSRLRKSTTSCRLLREDRMTSPTL